MFSNINVAVKDKVFVQSPNNSSSFIRFDTSLPGGVEGSKAGAFLLICDARGRQDRRQLSCVNVTAAQPRPQSCKNLAAITVFRDRSIISWRQPNFKTLFIHLNDVEQFVIELWQKPIQHRHPLL